MQKFNAYEVEIDRTIIARAIINSSKSKSNNNLIKTWMLSVALSLTCLKISFIVVLLCYFSFGIQNECYRYTLYIIKFNVNVVVNFFTPGYF